MTRLKVISSATLASAIGMLLIGAAPANAAINAQGAEQLKTLIQKYIDEQKQMVSAYNARMDTTGDLIVVPKDTYYQVITPYIKTVYPGNQSYDLGKIAINAMPGNTPDEWKVSFSLPSPISFKDENGKDIIKVVLGPQKTAGLWNTSMGYTTSLKATFDNINFTVVNDTAKPPVTGVIASINIDQSLTKDQATQKWSGPIRAKATDIKTTSEGPDKIQIGEIGLQYDISNLDTDSLNKFREQFKALGASGNAMANIENSPEIAKKSMDLFTEMFRTNFGEFTAKYEVKAFKASFPTAKPNPVDIGLDNGYVGVTFKQDVPNKTGAGFSFGFSGLTVPKTEWTNLTPTSADINIMFHDMPMADIMKVVQENNPALAKDPSTVPPANTPSPMAVLPEILSKAGTRVTQSLNINAPSYKVQGSGEAKASVTAITGFTADEMLTVEGLDAVMAELQKLSATSPDAKQALGPMTMMQMMGQQDPANPAVRTYHLIAAEDGKVTMNGSDLSSLTGMTPQGSDEVPAPPEITSEPKPSPSASH